MKILNKNECYLNSKDLEILIYNDINIPNDIYNLAIQYLKNNGSDNKYIKITNKKFYEYLIYTDLIPDFYDLYNKDICDLKSQYNKLENRYSKIEYISDNDYKSIISFYKEKKYCEYLINQIRQIIDYKEKTSKCNFPNIPNLSVDPVIGEGLIAYKSLDYDSIIIQNIDGSDIKNIDNDFCKTAYKILMRDEILDNSFILDENIKLINPKTIEVSSSKNKYIDQEELKLSFYKKYKKK